MTAECPADGLARELGLVRGVRAWFHGLPESIRARIDPEALGIDEQTAPSDGLQIAMLFVTNSDRLTRQLAAVCPLLQSKGSVLVAWPSSDGDAESDLDADKVREITVPHGLIEIKSIALDSMWNATVFTLSRQ